MEAKTNIAEILKDKPKGTKLYDLLYNVDIELDKISTTDTETVVWCTNETDNNNTCHRGYSEFGTVRGCPDGLQILLPSKEMRDWRKFDWKKGDVLISNDSDILIIFNGFSKDDYTIFEGKHFISLSEKRHISCLNMHNTQNYHIEDNKEVVQTYIKTIEEKLGSKLNRETLEIEKPQPEFKDGDIIVTASIPSMYYSKCIFILKGDLYTKDSKAHSYVFYNISNNHISFDIVDTIIRDREIRLATNPEKLQLFGMLTKEGKYWDSANKQIMDLKECQFKPFEKVLVRDSYEDEWRASFFSNIREGYSKYVTTGLVWKFCIPYEGNEHLLGTTNNVKD